MIFMDRILEMQSRITKKTVIKKKKRDFFVSSSAYFCIGTIHVYSNKLEICFLPHETYCAWSGCLYGRVWLYVLDVNYHTSHRACLDWNDHCLIICCISGNATSKWRHQLIIQLVKKKIMVFPYTCVIYWNKVKTKSRGKVEFLNFEISS